MRILVLTALCALAACSSAPQVSETGTAKAAEPATPAALTAAPANGKFEFKPPPGYKVKLDDWDVVYCRKMPILGSRFPKEVCMTEAELKEHMAANETMKRDKEQISQVCTSAAGCANP